MTDAFTAYQQEYLGLRTALARKLDDDLALVRGDDRTAALRRVARDLDELDEIVDQLALEARATPKLAAQVRAYKTELKGLHAQHSRLAAVSDRDLLLASRPAHSSYPLGTDHDDDDDGDGDNAQRARLLRSTHSLGTSSARLDNAHRLAAENEEIGQGVLTSLVGQRMQLVHANDHLEEADQSIDRARGTISKMVRLAYRQRLVIGLFIAALVALIGLILWSKFR
ncbi:hypothetical protein JCM3770_002341 [Rhodotorula araucariae]